MVGGKAAALGEMLKVGIPVPAGFVITTQAFENQDRKLSEILISRLLEAFDDLQTTHVAVRSSAVSEDGVKASWAGQLDTFLQVSRSQLIDRIYQCRASATSERAQAYAEQRGLSSSNMAVIVQRMVPSEVSGVAFSVHPVTQNQQHMVIEAGLGLGEAIVSGQITPDMYVVDKKTQTIIERTIVPQEKMLAAGPGGQVWEMFVSKAEHQKLSDAHVARLVRIVQTIQDYYGYPVDVEWALANDQLHITQARPITTLG